MNDIIMKMNENKEQYVYVMSNPSFPNDIFKIGWTREHPNIRANDLYTSGIPTPFIIECVVITPEGSKLEKKIHSHIQKYRINCNREFFKISKDELTKILTNDLTLKLTPITEIITPINKKTSHGKRINEIKEHYEMLEKEAYEFFNKLKIEGKFNNASRTFTHEYHMITQNIVYLKESINYLIDNYEEIKNKIGVKQTNKDNKSTKEMILDTHKRLYDLKNMV